MKPFQTLIISLLLFTGINAQNHLPLLPLPVDGKWCVFSEEGVLLKETRYDSVGLFNMKGLALITQDGKWGLMDQNLSTVLPPRYEQIEFFSDSSFIASAEMMEFYVFDRQLKKIAFADSIRYVNTLDYNLKEVEYVLCFSSKGKTVYFADGTRLNKTPYTHIKPFEGAIWIAGSPGAYGLIDRKGPLTDLEYDFIDVLDDELLIAIKAGERYYLKKDFKLLTDIPFDRVKTISSDLFVGYREKDAFLCDANSGEVLIHHEDLLDYFYFSDTYIAVRNDLAQIGLVDYKGDVVMRPAYLDLKPVKGDVVRAFYNDKYGLINIHREEILPFEFTDISLFEHDNPDVELDDCLMIQSWGKVGLADMQGNVVIPPKYDLLYPIDNNRLIAKRGIRFGVFGIQGEEIVKPEYHQVGWKDGLYLLRKDTLFGLANREGVLFKAEHKFISYAHHTAKIYSFSDSSVTVVGFNKQGVITDEPYVYPTVRSFEVRGKHPFYFFDAAPQSALGNRVERYQWRFSQGFGKWALVDNQTRQYVEKFIVDDTLRYGETAVIKAIHVDNPYVIRIDDFKLHVSDHYGYIEELQHPHQGLKQEAAVSLFYNQHDIERPNGYSTSRYRMNRNGDFQFVNKFNKNHEYTYLSLRNNRVTHYISGGERKLVRQKPDEYHVPLREYYLTLRKSSSLFPHDSISMEMLMEEDFYVAFSNASVSRDVDYSRRNNKVEHGSSGNEVDRIEVFNEDGEIFFRHRNGVGSLYSMSGIELFGDEDYYSIYPMFRDTNRLYVVQENYIRWGVLADEKDFVVPYDFLDIVPVPGGLFKFRKQAKWGLMNTQGVAIFPAEFDKINVNKEGYVHLRKENKEGVFDLSGKEILPLAYNSIEISDYRIVASQWRRNYDVYDLEGRLLIKEVQKIYSEETASRFIYKKDKKLYMLLENNEKVQLDDTYSKAYYLGDSCMLVVKRKQNRYLYNRCTDERITKVTHRGSMWRDGLLCVKDDKYGFINKEGDMVIPDSYSRCEDFNRGYAKVKVISGWGIIDTLGNEVVPTAFDRFTATKEGVCFAHKNDSVYMMRYDGKLLHPPFKGSVVREMENGFAIISLFDQGIRYVDTEGALLPIEGIIQAYPFTDYGLAKVLIKGKWHTIDTTGKVVSKGYPYLEILSEDHLAVSPGMFERVITRDGEDVVPHGFEKCIPITPQTIRLELQGVVYYFKKGAGIFLGKKPDNALVEMSN